MSQQYESPHLLNAVHYETVRSPFSGNGAQFGCTYSPDGPVGIARIHARAAQFTRFITEATLQLWIETDGRWQAPHRQSMTSHPACAEESTIWNLSGSRLRIHARTVYTDDRCAWHEQTITNAGAEPIAFGLALCGQIGPDNELNPRRTRQTGESFSPRQPFVTVDGTALRCGYTGDPRLPRPALQLDAVTGIADIHTGTLPVWAGGLETEAGETAPDVPGPIHYALRHNRVTLAPDATHRLLVCIRYVPAAHGEPEHDWPDTPRHAPDLDRLIQSQQDAIDRTLNAAHDTQLMRARFALLRCSYQGIDAAFGPHRACLCSPGVTAFSISFFWDSLFSSAGITGFDAAYARDAIRVPLRKVRGRWAQRNWDWRLDKPERVPQPQAPIASWALAHHLARHDDDEFLEEMYPVIADLHRFWQTQDADGDGLPEWSFTGLNADNGPHYNAYMPWQVHNVYIPPIASVSLASFLHLDALLLADFAVKLGHTDDAAAWRERAAFLAERLEAVCWHDEDGFYYDFDHHVGEHNRVRTHLVFWPLWAGVSMDAERKRRLIEDVLLDPNQFNGPVPFPTCAFDDPNYDPESYWSGRSWPHITYWLIELLAREGYEAEARRAGGRWLAWQSAHTGQREAVTTNPHLTEHAEGGDFTYRTGRDFDYNWAAAAVALLREERYRTFVPLGRV